MNMKIVVGVEGESDGREAVAVGAMLARALGASLVLAGVYSTVLGPAAYAYEIAGRTEVEERLARASDLVPYGVRFETRPVPSTSVVRGLHELAERLEADLIVIGPTRPGRPARLLAGDHTLGLLQAAPCAIAIAPPHRDDGAPQRGPVGVAYVPTPEGREALDVGITLAEALRSALRILYAAAATEASAEVLEDARGEVPAGLAVETLLLDGVDADSLLRVASEDLTLLVMGSRGYGPTRRVLLGSVSAGVVHEAACPIIVVPRGTRVPAGVEVRA
jgi:nucleotide-binding universal stress UspA family protein